MLIDPQFRLLLIHNIITSIDAPVARNPVTGQNNLMGSSRVGYREFCPITKYRYIHIPADKIKIHVQYKGMYIPLRLPISPDLHRHHNNM